MHGRPNFSYVTGRTITFYHIIYNSNKTIKLTKKWAIAITTETLHNETD